MIDYLFCCYFSKIRFCSIFCCTCFFYFHRPRSFPQKVTASLLSPFTKLTNTATDFFKFKVQCQRARMVLKFHLNFAIKRFPKASTSWDLNLSLIFSTQQEFFELWFYKVGDSVWKLGLSPLVDICFSIICLWRHTNH